MDALAFQTIKRLSLADGLWFCGPVGPVGQDGTGVKFEGYFIPPFLIPQKFSVTVNCVEVFLEFGTERSRARFKDIFLRFESLQEQIGFFTFSFHITNPSVFPEQDVISIQLSGLQSESMMPFYFATSIDLPIPEVRGMVRTTHIRDIDTFNFIGLTDFKRIQSMMTRNCSTPPDKPLILDWGCGCGRVSRFVEFALGKGSVYGVDIDPVSIEWNKEHLDHDRYSLISFEPALPFENSSFDLIYGISVMTHLKSADQTSWLKELHRILKPKGILVLTYHGLAMFFAHVNNGTILEQLLTNGFWDQGRNPDLDEGFAEFEQQELYRNTFNTIHDIATKVADLFEIRQFIPGGHLAQHDYFVFSKPEQSTMPR